MKLEGKVAIITGAGSGMGAEEAKMFAAEGARVVITDINAEACRKVADEIGEAAIAIEHDVANEEGWGVGVATPLEKFGKIDKIGRATGRERGCKKVKQSVVVVTLKKNKKKT